MRQHVGFAADRTHQTPIAPDHERRSLPRERTHAPGSERAVNLTIRVAEQWEPETVRLSELLLPINLIGADSHPLGPELSELSGQVTEMTAFLRSTRRHCLWVEEDNNRAGLDQIRERDRRAVLIKQFEIVNEFAFVQRSLPKSRTVKHLTLALRGAVASAR